MSIATRGDPIYTHDENAIVEPPEEGFLDYVAVLIAPVVSFVDHST